MKKSSVRMLMLSCLAITAAGVSPALAQQASEQAVQDYQASMSAVAAANAAAGYTGNPAMAAQAAQTGQAMTPAGMQTGQPVTMTPGGPLVPGTFGPPAPGMNINGQPQQEVTMRYNKKEVDGFYGVELPKRLFNNVPSDW